MPREYQGRVNSRTLEANTPDPVGYEVAASPVSMMSEAPRSNGALKLAESLSTLNAGLAPYVQQRLKEEEDSQYQEGMLGYLNGDNTTDRSESYMDGFMKLKWDDFGRQSKQQIKDQFEQAKADPSLDVNGLIKARITEDLKGIQEDPRAIEAYLAHMMPLMGELGSAHSEFHRAAVEEESSLLLSSRMQDIVDPSRSADEIHQMYVNDWPTWQAMGKSRKDMAVSMWSALVAQAETTMDPTLLEAALKQDESGISIASVIGEDRVKAQQKQVTDALTKKRFEDNMVYRDTKLSELNTLLETDPTNEALNFENLLKLHGTENVFNREGELPAYWAKVLAKRGQGMQENAYGEYMLTNRAPVIWKAESEKPEFKKFYDAETAKVWAKLGNRGDDPTVLGAVIGELTKLHELSGVPPRELVGLLGNINVASVDAAKGQVSPDIVLAMQLYRAAADQGKGDLIHSYTKDKSRAFLSLLNDRLKNGPISGETIAAAAMTIKMAESDEQIQANKQTVYSNTFKEDLKREVTDAFSGWFDFNDATNVSDINAMAHSIAAREVTQHHLSPEDAAKVAIDWVKSRYTRTGNGYAFPVHQQDVGRKEDLTKGTELWLKEYAEQNGELTRYAIRLAEDGRSYRLFNGTSGLPAAVLTSDELLMKARPASYGPVQRRAEAATFIRDIKSSINFGRTKVTPELLKKIQDNPELVGAALAGDDLNALEKTELKALVARQQSEQHKQITAMVQNINSLTKHGNVLTDGGKPSASIPAKLRDGTPANVGQLAAYYYKTSPKAALAMVAEGLVLKAQKDSDGSLAIGFGYNFGARTEAQAAKDLQAAGIQTSDIASVMTGGKAITTEQAIKLFEVSSKKYEAEAKKAYGDGYDKLPPHVRTVLFDMAYNAGSPSKFTTVLKLFKEGKYDEASKNLTLKFKDENGKWHNNERRVRLWREMLSGKFDQYLSYYKKGK